MQAQDIEKYLSQLGQELVKLGVDQPIRVLMIGGAYMTLLADAPRSTDDLPKCSTNVAKGSMLQV